MAVLLCSPLMPYNVLTIDGVLGCVLLIPTQSCGVVAWRVLEYEPGPEGEEDRGHLRCCQRDNAASRINLHWPTVQAMLTDGSIIVE